MSDSSESRQSVTSFWGYGSAAAFEAAVGQNVRKHREGREMSQRYVVEVLNEDHMLGWHQTTLAKTESGERPLRLSEAIALADVLGVSPEALNPLSGSGNVEDSAILLRARAQELARVAKDVDHRRAHLLRMADDMQAGKDWDFLADGPKAEYDA